MRSWFERWRGTRGKRVTVARTVTQNSLNQAWASFVDCWSEETGAAFRETIVARGATHARMSVGHCQQGSASSRGAQTELVIMSISWRVVDTVAGTISRDNMNRSGNDLSPNIRSQNRARVDRLVPSPSLRG
ncbi:hypothetical protein GQ600_25074 [Phytophthora cactorum]|nr:hypothetical protein GQ600_25074 [Phytophthora cactorum]